MPICFSRARVVNPVSGACGKAVRIDVHDSSRIWGDSEDRRYPNAMKGVHDNEQLLVDPSNGKVYAIHETDLIKANFSIF